MTVRTIVVLVALLWMPQWAELHAQRLRVETAPPRVSPVGLQEVARGRSRAREGAILGFVVGAVATYVVTHSGGSTAPCDRSANQDAMSSAECAGLVVLGGLAGAGVGALIGSQIHFRANASAVEARVRLEFP
jgi:hypothetical protein